VLKISRRVIQRREQDFAT